MRTALTLAEHGLGRVSPNPLVGAVVVDAAGQVVGRGWHEGPGTRHAEVMALDEAGRRARGATVVCTLEPCDHTGRTGPCTRALLEAGVASVVVATLDPNPLVDGRGIERLRAAGVEVSVGVLEAEARRQNAAFLTHVRTGRPFVVLKMAASLDGRTAARDGSARWITGEDSRADAHRLRAWADAVLVGAGTAIADDPALTVRSPAPATARPPLRVIVDAVGRVPPRGRVFDGAASTLMATTERTPRERRDAWGSAGAEVVCLDPDGDGNVSLTALVDLLGKRDVQGLLIEGGATLAWSAVREGVVDRVVLYVAPVLIGGSEAPGILGGAGFAPLAAAPRLGPMTVERLGEDLRMEADVHRDR
jgi:diaminohydroxyphosphoribosylaminopyrimidine deaminase/5-amino-6-(5-phosphoribosylamino)uracil reductase